MVEKITPPEATCNNSIVLALDNPTILVITDRNDLDDQLFDTFAASTQLIVHINIIAKNSWSVGIGAFKKAALLK
jgi:hypothetical protein